FGCARGRDRVAEPDVNDRWRFLDAEHQLGEGGGGDVHADGHGHGRERYALHYGQSDDRGACLEWLLDHRESGELDVGSGGWWQLDDFDGGDEWVRAECELVGFGCACGRERVVEPDVGDGGRLVDALDQRGYGGGGDVHADRDGQRCERYAF